MTGGICHPQIIYACHQINVITAVYENHKGVSGIWIQQVSVPPTAQTVPVWAVRQKSPSFKQSNSELLKSSSFLTGALLSLGTGGWKRLVWRSFHQKNRPVAQGIISSRFYQEAARDSIWQLTCGQKAVLTAGNDPWKHVRPHAWRDRAEMSDNTSFVILQLAFITLLLTTMLCSQVLCSCCLFLLWPQPSWPCWFNVSFCLTQQFSCSFIIPDYSLD